VAGKHRCLLNHATVARYIAPIASAVPGLKLASFLAEETNKAGIISLPYYLIKRLESCAIIAAILNGGSIWQNSLTKNRFMPWLESG
jgi:hypothetical protein